MKPYGSEMMFSLKTARGAVQTLAARIEQVGRAKRCGPESDRVRVNLRDAADKLLRCIEEVEAPLRAKYGEHVEESAGETARRLALVAEAKHRAGGRPLTDDELDAIVDPVPGRLTRLRQGRETKACP
jgi:hypothetical protein